MTTRLLLCFSLIALPLHAGDFRVGAARVDITPKDGTPLGGYYHFRGSAGVLDPLYAKTIVMEKDGTHAVIVVLDLSGTVRPIVAATRKLIQEQCGIEGDHVLISGTHTHSGPQQPRGSMMDDLTKVNSPPGVAYMSALPGRITESVKQAKAKLAPVNASVAIGKAEGISFNRRILREGQQEAIWQPKALTAKDRPAGPVDPEVGVLLFQGAGTDATPVASLLNFAMHPTSVGGGVKISADYPGVFTKLVSERHGPEMISVFANGTCGNINHTDYITGKRRSTLELGTALADAADAAWPNLKVVGTFAPRVRSEQVTLRRRTFTEAQIAKAKDMVANMLTTKFGTVPMAETVCILETLDKKDKPLLAEVQVIAISDDVAVVALPGEIFVELGLALKKASPFKHTFIAELSNGSIGYVPNKEAYPQGNYEIVSARGEAGSGEKLVEVALKLLNEAKTAK
ncbi:MAG: neutral/alkaline non-lysosomal ceramidase N-terminal domain-containing protein [Prosthecobacter sp.]|jgi:neutral ceramidase|uniref:neutral/alkaline non-lysosomal ceramidase N-terminal domain-containing protein n=1 Tax=Prosthecobacter sp. TaxID=1965333 RepID=UPI0019DD01BF|nr:neutral/alkaline non-lysosomal ceramidase N-terminal domain-containing protein [Prosthecobacter sp.]MBE2284219.1 neutral/alkaline non-lysosomal ceramidase N-terminal domain-containing protein [Prosthecobacter sp.]